jgi:hypothetical protein
MSHGDLSDDIVERLSPDLPGEILFLWASIANTVAPELWPMLHTNFIRSRVGDIDIIGYAPTDLFPCIKYKTIFYTGQWSGGETIFPEIDFQYKAEQNDLLIIDYSPTHVTQSAAVKSGIKYVNVSYLTTSPGYFYG